MHKDGRQNCLSVALYTRGLELGHPLLFPAERYHRNVRKRFRAREKNKGLTFPLPAQKTPQEALLGVQEQALYQYHKNNHKPEQQEP